MHVMSRSNVVLFVTCAVVSVVFFPQYFSAAGWARQRASSLQNFLFQQFAKVPKVPS